ncbi:MAG: energy-coupling factor transporter ATPase [Clostridiales bacterium]|nr:energy-coupling factor transporter ATPase [Clostridiales bacterium]
MSIKAENLTYTYMKGTPFEATAIEDVSFEIQDGEFVAIIGHTGSGKSTLIQMLNGLLKPTSGRVLVDNVAFGESKKDLKEVRGKVGIVFQYPEYQLFEETVAKDVAFGPRNQGVDEEEIEKRVKNAIEDMGLDYEEIKDMSPFELSGGQKRRVAIAGVLAMKPQIIVFDEPTAGLDPKGRELLFARIERLKTKGKTIILVSHSMDDVARLADRVFVMYNGKLAATGTPKEIFCEECKNYGLYLPQITELVTKLNGTGKFNIDTGVFNVEDVVDEIIKEMNSNA